MSALTRRRFLGAGGATLLGLGLAACGNGGEPGGSSKDIQFAWWGNDERDRRTRDAIAAFQASTKGVKVRPQVTNWDGYWDKMATQTAGGNPPDLIQMDYAYITEYAKRNTLLALDEFIPEKLGIADFDEHSLNSGKVDGKLYGATMGINSVALFYNKTTLQKSGLEMPDDTMTWSQFADLAKQVAAKNPGNFGTPNGLLSDVPFECWLRQRGKSFFTEKGELGFEPADFVEWMTYWDELSKAKAAIPAEVETASSGDVSDAPILTGKAAFAFMWSNQLTALTAATKDEIGIHMFPQGDAPDSRPGQFYKASMLLSISAKTDGRDTALELANALLTEPEIAGKLGFERGVPPSPKVRDALVAKATPAERATAEYIQGIEDKIGDPQAPPPQKAAEVEQAFAFSVEQAAFGKLGVEAAVDKFFDDATKVLE